MTNLQRRISATIVLVLLLLGFSHAQKRNLLTGTYSAESIQRALIDRNGWHPFPRATEREQWLKLPEAMRLAYIKRGEESLSTKWPILPATLYLDYARTGNRENYQRPYFERRQKIQNLVLAECMEGKGMFLDEILNGLWLLFEETSWVIPAHVKGLQRGEDLPKHEMQVVDLFAAETGTLVAWTYYLLADELGKVSPLIPNRMRDELQARILKPNLERDDFWWMWTDVSADREHHINNWTPWICSNWLAAILLVEDNMQARVRGVHKVMKTLDQFTNSYPDDGGCDEGPSYWGRAGGSLFECLELLESATQGSVKMYSKPLVQEIGRYIYRAHINGQYYVNFSDAPAKVNIQSDLVVRYGDKIGDRNLAQLGTYAAGLQRLEELGVSGSLTRELTYIFNLDVMKKHESKAPLVKDVWLPGTRFVAARQREGSAEGLYVAAQGLHNDKSHNHNDCGNFIVYLDGEPAIIDVGVETYTARTFSGDRYSIWTMQSAYHNLPTVNGVMQKNGKQYTGRDVKYRNGGEEAQFSLDIAGAYPPEAGIVTWFRSVTLDREEGEVRVEEKYHLKSADKGITLTLMTPCEVSDAGRGQLVLTMPKGEGSGTAKRIHVKYDPAKLASSVEAIDVKDNQLKRVWGPTLRRILLTVKSKELKESLGVTIGRHLQ